MKSFEACGAPAVIFSESGRGIYDTISVDLHCLFCRIYIHGYRLHYFRRMILIRTPGNRKDLLINLSSSCNIIHPSFTIFFGH